MRERQTDKMSGMSGMSGQAKTHTGQRKTADVKALRKSVRSVRSYCNSQRMRARARVSI
jgi:methylaspartate ammonia-lyase